jgi:hypothetical protein
MKNNDQGDADALEGIEQEAAQARNVALREEEEESGDDNAPPVLVGPIQHQNARQQLSGLSHANHATGLEHWEQEDDDAPYNFQGTQLNPSRILSISDGTPPPVGEAFNHLYDDHDHDDIYE